VNSIPWSELIAEISDLLVLDTMRAARAKGVSVDLVGIEQAVRRYVDKHIAKLANTIDGGMRELSANITDPDALAKHIQNSILFSPEHALMLARKLLTTGQQPKPMRKAVGTAKSSRSIWRRASPLVSKAAPAVRSKREWIY
jgi:hypothetical protein